MIAPVKLSVSVFYKRNAVIWCAKTLIVWVSLYSPLPCCWIGATCNHVQLTLCFSHVGVSTESLLEFIQLPHRDYDSVVSFMIAFLVCLLETTLVTRLLTGTVGLICITFISWCVWMNWDYGTSKHNSWWNTSIDALHHWKRSLGKVLQSLWRRLCREDMQTQAIPMHNI